MKFERWSALWAQMKKRSSFSMLIFGVIGLVMFLAMIKTALPDKIDVQLHQISDRDIQSPIEIVDQQTTDNLRDQAVADAPTSYVYNKDASMIQVEKVNDIFNVFQEIRDKDKTESTTTADSNDKSKEKTSAPASMDDQIKATHKKLTDAFGEKLTDSTLQTLLTISDREFSLAQDITSSTIYEAMNDKIKWGNLEDKQDTAIKSIPKSVVSDDLHKALADILKRAIVPNYVFDATMTKRNKEDAAKTIDPVIIRQGEVIVKKGDLITRNVIHKLKVVGLMDNHFNTLPFFGLAILVLFMTALIALEFRDLRWRAKAPSNALLIYLCLFFVTIVIIKIGSLLKGTHIPEIGLIIPAASGPLMIAMLLKKRLAMVSSIIFAVCGGFIYGATTSSASIFDFSMALYILITALAGATVIRGDHARPRLLQTGMIISIINILAVVCLMFIKNGTLHFTDAGIQIGFAVLSGFLATVLTIGLMPFFEATFGILSTMKLIELSNPNHPLLRKILMEAPGTYHHSVMVANLAERACEVIGANGLLARVAAYYHDIGKTKRPHFFIENQMNGINPHDKVSPQLSKSIIISHPYDGANLLREHKFPKEIIDVAEQHHGTTLLKFFYQKASEEIGQPVPEIEYRYPGPKALTKETAVIELADCVEAAVRSMSKPNPEKIEQLVQKIFNDRLEDGQFDECDLTMRELNQVKTSVCETLNGIFHSRIEYPDDLNKKVQSG